MYALTNKVQNYAWGRNAENSTVFKYLEEQNPEGQPLDKETTYAELWMGSHKKAESSVIVKKENGTQEAIPLSQFMNDRFSQTLPYLFKVLSIRKCLSIQAHPNKELAAQLHAKDPEHYPDANHKPEMAIALTNFKAFSNFAPVEVLASNLERYSEFSERIKGEIGNLRAASDEESQKKALKELFLAVNASTEEQIMQVVNQAQKFKDAGEAIERDEQVLMLHSQFGADNGILVTLMLNYIDLKPGECFGMNPLEPHAYFSGECFECKDSIFYFYPFLVAPPFPLSFQIL